MPHSAGSWINRTEHPVFWIMQQWQLPVMPLAFYNWQRLITVMIVMTGPTTVSRNAYNELASWG